MNYTTYLLIVLLILLSACENQKTSLDINNCENDKDCETGYSCQCAEIIPACPMCEGGKCIYRCVELNPSPAP